MISHNGELPSSQIGAKMPYCPQDCPPFSITCYQLSLKGTERLAGISYNMLMVPLPRHYTAMHNNLIERASESQGKPEVVVKLNTLAVR